MPGGAWGGRIGQSAGERKGRGAVSGGGERALGSAVGQIGISIGMVVALVLASGFHAPTGGDWRSWPLVLGFAWIPLWLATA